MAVGILDSALLILLVVSHLVAALLTVGLAGFAARNHGDKLIGRVFTLMVGSFTIWILGSLGRLFTTDPGTYVAITTFKYVGITTAPVWFLLFALLYDGKEQWVTRRTAAALLVLPALTLVVLATTRIHGLFYTDFTTTTIAELPILATSAGPWFWLFASFGWGLLVVGSILFITGGLKRSGFYRAQSAVVMVAILVSWVANLAYVFFDWPHPALDPTPLGFAVTSLLLAAGIFSTRLIDIVPAARSLVLDAIDDAVIVLDPEHRIVDVNAAARPIVLGDRPIGNPVSEELPIDLTQSTPPELTIAELTVDGETRFYRLRQLPVGPDGTHGEVIVLTDITAQVRTRRDLERQNEQLDGFASVVSHDLRNPLNVAQGSLELIREEQDSDLHVTLQRALSRMETLIENLLSLARHGQTVDELDSIDLGESARRAWQTVDTANATLELEDDLQSVPADSQRLIQLFENLFRNAIEHGGPGVTVRVGSNGDGFFVEDDGVGLPAATTDQLFDRGFTTTENGTGFGLTIVASIAEAHGWEITASSTDNGGARFDITTQTPHALTPTPQPS